MPFWKLGSGFAWVTALVAVVALPSPAQAQDQSNDDTITAYDTEAVINDDGTVDMTETITYDFGETPSPGIHRHIPLLMDTGAFQGRVVDINGLTVDSPTGADTSLDDLSESGGELVILVGDKSTPANHVTGEQTYELSYTVEGALTSHEEHDEFHWDLVGYDWDVPKEDVTVDVAAPGGIDEVSCFSGPEGTESSCRGMEFDEASMHAAETSQSPEAGLTVRVGLEPGTVDVSQPEYQLRPGWIPSVWSLGIGALIIAALTAIAVYRARADRAARARSTRIPEDMSPGAAAYTCVKGQISARTIMAMLIHLEERGHVSSDPHPDRDEDWQFTLVTARDDQGLSAAEKHLVGLMFAQDAVSDLETLKSRLNQIQGAHIAGHLQEEQKQLGMIGNLGLSSLVKLGLPVAAVIGAGVLLIAGENEIPFSGSYIVAGLCAAYVLGSVLMLGAAPTNPYGRHVYNLLQVARADTMNGDSLSVEGHPAWEVALDVPNPVVDDFVEEHEQRHARYYHNTRYRDRWDRTLDAGLSHSSSGGSGGGSGSSGGGRSGGGGGGGGGGRH